jgi:hypothetical protein
MQPRTQDLPQQKNGNCVGEFGKRPELQARQHWRAGRGNVDHKPIPDEVAAECNNWALQGLVILDRMAWVSAIGGNTKAALDISLPLTALLGLELGPFLLHPLEILQKLFL